MEFRILLVVLLSLYSVNGFSGARWLHMQRPDLEFSGGNCGPATDPIQLKSVNVQPDPIRMPGNETVSFSVAISSALPTEIHASLTLEKKLSVIGWVKVPCDHDVGSCSYSDFCAKWSGTCNEYFKQFGFPCQCPIPAGTYTVPNAIIDFTKKLPSQANGEFRLTVNIGSGSTQLGCFNFHFNLKS